MRFGVLGPLQTRDEADGARSVTGTRQRVLLAALLVHVNQVVSAEQLVEIVWDGTPPTGAAALRTQVMRLRRALGPGAGSRIVTREPGYAIALGDEELDATLFESWCRIAGSALRGQRWEEASQAAERALLLWRGPPLVDVPSQVLREAVVPRLEQLRAQVHEDRAEAQLWLGCHEQLVPQLRELTGAHPLREKYHAQLMLALYRSGRQAEALAAYQDARRLLVEELGVEPGPQLRELHNRILTGEEIQPPSTPSAAQALAPAVAVRAVPRQLPAAPGHYTGRHGELEMLASLADLAGATAWTGGAVVISAIDGMAGIGKTALAVHAAHRLSAQFPGGQLFIDLHGYTKGYSARSAGGALEAFLRALGVPAEQIPKDTDERAALYRQFLAGTRTLIVLDNALNEAQVRPLLPANPGCLVLVTSRRRLKGLDDARSLSLDLLPPNDAAVLLCAVAGSDRIPADDPALAKVAELCGYLPLALRIAGALLRHRPAWNLQHLARLLQEQHRRIHVLSDGERNLAAVFSLSYAGLSERHQLLFRRLGLLLGPDTDAYAAAALLTVDPDTGAGLLEDLVDHNLLIEHAPGRYRLHDLVRAYARTLRDRDNAKDQRAALDRVLHYYTHTAQSASALIARHPRHAASGTIPSYAPALPDPETARAWLRAERDNLEAASAHARTHALDEHAIALAAGLAEILRADGPWARALELHEAAAATAERTGRRAAYAAALNEVGRVRHLAGDLPSASDALARALDVFREIGDRHGQAAALIDLGRVRCMTADIIGGDDALTQALEVFREIDDRHGQAAALNELGRVRLLAGDYSAADGALTRALDIFREIGNRLGEAATLNDLGRARRETGDLRSAGDTIAGALGILRTLGYRHGEANALVNLGIVQRLTGDYRAAGVLLSQALEIFRESGARGDEAWALVHYAATIAADNDPARAHALYRQALAMSRELNKPDDEAAALEGIGECYLSTGETVPGTSFLCHALDIFNRLSMASDVERVHARLTNLNAA